MKHLYKLHFHAFLANHYAIEVKNIVEDRRCTAPDKTSRMGPLY